MSSAALASTHARVRRLFTLETVVRPHTLLLIGGGLSFLAWVIPWGSRVPSTVRGFARTEPLTLHGTLFLLGWWGFFFVVALGGFALGRRIPPFRPAEDVPWESYYVFLTILGVVGLAYSYAYVLAKSPHAIGLALQHQQFNEVRRVLPAATGVQTLRYATALSGAIGIFELGRRRFRLLHVLNILLLLLTSTFAARTTLIIAAIVAAGLAARHLQTTRVAPRRLVGSALLGLVALFLALALLNYSRNAGFYRSHRIDDPTVMNVGEMVRYLGFPFQASVAVSNHVSSWPAVPSSVAAGTRVFVLPTYLSSSTPESVSRGETRYASVVSVPASYTTPSVLAVSWGVFGALAFPVLGFVALVAAALAGHASRYRSYAFLAAFVVGYCFSEWWRTWVFNTGLTQFLVLAIAFWALVGPRADDWTRGRWTRFTRSILLR
jgi:hypothetical protein